ncbi:MAG: choice-of-anchor D domain-containing protein [Phycisphaeraceae bacterium]|nr:choice-of-anchor D domain-containing protein [Phycisphaeraceae bacterium]
MNRTPAATLLARLGRAIALRPQPPRSRTASKRPFAPAPFTPERLEDRVVLAADLNLTEINTLNTVVIPGNEFSGEYVIMNDGDEASTTFRVEFRLSRNTTYGDADDILLGFRDISAPIAPGGQAAIDQDFDLPRNVFTGNYFMAALVDSLGQIAEPNENNNLRFTTIAQIIIVSASGQTDIDLEAVGVAATTGSYNAGQSFPGVATYRNTGTAPSGAFVTIWFLSTDQIYGNADDIELAVATSSAGLPGEASFDDSFSLQIPINTPSGSYFFGVFVDARFDINEPLAEEDNIDFSATPAVTVVGVPMIPDLQVSGVVTQTATYLPGDEITFTATIRNAGNADTGQFEVTYSLTTDTQMGNQDDVVLVFKAVLASIGPGATFTDTRTITIPTNAAAEDYFLGVQLDPDDEIDEGAGEQNNEGFTATRLVTIEEPPPPVPTIEVFGGGGLDRMLTHSTKARRADGTGFGPVEKDNGSKDITYKITNAGTEPLLITAIEPRGQVPADYEVIVLPNDEIPAGESTTFRVRFVPSEFGTRRANIAIFTNDPSRPRFTMRVAGRGVPPDSAADIDVRGNNNSISDGDRKARSNTHTKYGDQTIGETFERIYTIRNEGQSTLTLLSDPVSIGGQDPSQFNIIAQPATLILEPGQSTTFTVQFAPTETGKQKADVTILSDDLDEDVFSFRIVGTGSPA